MAVRNFLSFLSLPDPLRPPLPARRRPAFLGPPGRAGGLWPGTWLGLSQAGRRVRVRHRRGLLPRSPHPQTRSPPAAPAAGPRPPPSALRLAGTARPARLRAFSFSLFKTTPSGAGVPPSPSPGPQEALPVPVPGRRRSSRSCVGAQ